MLRTLRQALTTIGAVTASPWAFFVVGVYAIVWLTVDHESLNWHGAATLATWLMTLFIQRAEHRDTQAIQAKLDELLRLEGAGDAAITTLDDREPEEIERHRHHAQREDRGASPPERQ
jgi:low affinity Fe/Cu permease